MVPDLKKDKTKKCVFFTPQVNGEAYKTGDCAELIADCVEDFPAWKCSLATC